MKKLILAGGIFLVLVLAASWSFSAYHHMGEEDSGKFLSVYPDKASTKIDQCALCHCGGEVIKSGKTTRYGSCQWCHYSYGYDGKGSGGIVSTLNPYGKAYHDHGRNVAAVTAIDNLDSDGDEYTNRVEILANRYPGDAQDDPTKVFASSRVYTRGQLEAMPRHTQFLLMNTSRSGDFYAEYTGVTVENLLENAGILESATGITVFSPDGFSTSHPLEPDADESSTLYHVRGTYPSAIYQYDTQASAALGWCDYSAPSCTGRNANDPISVPDGLKLLLAMKRDGAYLDQGQLTSENKLDGEGPFRIVPPQKKPCSPDQSSTAKNQDVTWLYNSKLDHNAGFSTRSVTMIRVEPLPQGTTDIDVYEAGWSYVDQGKIIVYGAIGGSDSNGNGILDSEEGSDPNSDFDRDGTPDFQDSDTANFKHAQGNQKVLLHTSKGSLADVKALSCTDPSIPQESKPSMLFPYGVNAFKITDLDPAHAESVTISIVFPDNVPTTAKYYKISTTNGWREIPFGSNDGDNTITITLTDGDNLTDADGIADGKIFDPGALALPNNSDSNGNGILDSEEGSDPNSDFDHDGTPDFQDSDTATFKHAQGNQKVLLHTSKGSLADVKALSSTDPSIPQEGKPSMVFPYGVNAFEITDLNPSQPESVTISIVFPDKVPTTAKYYKISAADGWREIPLGSNDGDNTITITLTDGDNLTDADGIADGKIFDPGALALPNNSESSEGDSGTSCFISALFSSSLKKFILP